MKYGKIYTYENRNEAEIGKRYVFSDFYKDVCKIPEKKNHSTLAAVENKVYPFRNDDGYVAQFIREVIEEEPALMTNRQLSEWLAKGNGQMRSAGALLYSLLVYEPKNEHDAVPKNIRIRRWDSDEWVVPTVDIYERDCR